MSPGRHVEVGQQPPKLSAAARASSARSIPARRRPRRGSARSAPVRTVRSIDSRRCDPSTVNIEARHHMSRCCASSARSVVDTGRGRSRASSSGRSHAVAPLTRRTPSRRCPLKATAVTAQLRSTASACVSESSDMLVSNRSERADVREHPVPEPDDQTGSAPCGDVAQDLPYPVHCQTSLPVGCRMHDAVIGSPDRVRRCRPTWPASCRGCRNCSSWSARRRRREGRTRRCRTHPLPDGLRRRRGTLDLADQQHDHRVIGPLVLGGPCR